MVWAFAYQMSQHYWSTCYATLSTTLSRPLSRYFQVLMFCIPFLATLSILQLSDFSLRHAVLRKDQPVLSFSPSPPRDWLFRSPAASVCGFPKSLSCSVEAAVLRVTAREMARGWNAGAGDEWEERRGGSLETARMLKACRDPTRSELCCFLGCALCRTFTWLFEPQTGRRVLSRDPLSRDPLSRPCVRSPLQQAAAGPSAGLSRWHFLATLLFSVGWEAARRRERWKSVLCLYWSSTWSCPLSWESKTWDSRGPFLVISSCIKCAAVWSKGHICHAHVVCKNNSMFVSFFKERGALNWAITSI